MANPDEASLRQWYAEIESRFEGKHVSENVHELYRREFKAWQGTSVPSVDPYREAEEIAARINARRAHRGTS